MLINRSIDYNSLPRDLYFKELGKVAMRSAVFAVVMAFLALFVVGVGLRHSYASEAPRATLPAPDLPGTALVHAHYDILSDAEKAAYKEIEDALRGMKSGASLPDGIDCDMLERVYDSVLADNPDIFWVSISYFSYRNLGPAGIPFVSFSYLYDDPAEVEAKHASYLAEAARLTEEFTLDALEDGTQASQARAAYDWLAENLDYAHTDRDQTVSGAFDDDDGYTVCAGYAKSFKLLCDQMGIPCIYISGMTDQQQDSRHAWNMMIADGYVYYVDATWGDYGSYGKDKWFTTSSQAFESPSRDAFEPRLVNNIKAMGYEEFFANPVSDIMMEDANENAGPGTETEFVSNIWDIAFSGRNKAIEDAIAKAEEHLAEQERTDADVVVHM